jgi:hypothetical protein
MKRYKGPSKPIPTHREPISDKAEAVIFIVLAVIFILFLILEVI